MTQAACVRNQDGYQLGTYLGAHILRLQRRYKNQTNQSFKTKKEMTGINRLLLTLKATVMLDTTEV